MNEYDNLYVDRERPLSVYKIFDPIVGKFCRSGRSLYGRPRSVWGNKSSAMNALKSMPDDVQNRAVIKKFCLLEVED